MVALGRVPFDLFISHLAAFFEVLWQPALLAAALRHLRAHEDRSHPRDRPERHSGEEGFDVHRLDGPRVAEGGRGIIFIIISIPLLIMVFWSWVWLAAFELTREVSALVTLLIPCIPVAVLPVMAFMTWGRNHW